MTGYRADSNPLAHRCRSTRSVSCSRSPATRLPVAFAKATPTLSPPSAFGVVPRPMGDTLMAQRPGVLLNRFVGRCLEQPGPAYPDSLRDTAAHRGRDDAPHTLTGHPRPSCGPRVTSCLGVSPGAPSAPAGTTLHVEVNACFLLPAPAPAPYGRLVLADLRGTEDFLGDDRLAGVEAVPHRERTLPLRVARIAHPVHLHGQWIGFCPARTLPPADGCVRPSPGVYGCLCGSCAEVRGSTGLHGYDEGPPTGKRPGQRPLSLCGRCRIRTYVGIRRRIYRTTMPTR
jgi:hypothetical protein